MKKTFVVTVLILILAAARAFGGQAALVLYTEDTPARAAAGITVPEGFVCPPGESSAGEVAEYYLYPAGADSEVRFLYYTAGKGDPRALAEAALGSYGVLYDEFGAGEIRSEDFGGRGCLWFDYTCAYPNRAGDAPVYEQTAVVYVPAKEGEFIACILSLSFDSPESYLSAEEIRNRAASAVNAVEVYE